METVKARLAGFAALAAVVGIGAWTLSVSAQENKEASSALASLPDPYLAQDAVPDSLALLPPPPEAGSAAMARDEQARTATIPLRNGARWALADSDANLAFPHAPGVFSCAAGVDIGPATTPKLYALMGRMAVDVGLSTYKAKNHYQRTRPFMAHNEGTCRPVDEEALKTDGSYPSGHSAIGWGWGLLLAEVFPSRADAVLQRGREFGQSRVVCDAHWQSDVDAGRVVSSATVARLHADPGFLADLDAAKREAAGALAAAPANQCNVERAALAIR